MSRVFLWYIPNTVRPGHHGPGRRDIPPLQSDAADGFVLVPP